jgi:hypothetical protein
MPPTPQGPRLDTAAHEEAGCRLHQFAGPDGAHRLAEATADGSPGDLEGRFG